MGLRRSRRAHEHAFRKAADTGIGVAVYNGESFMVVKLKKGLHNHFKSGIVATSKRSLGKAMSLEQ